MSITLQHGRTALPKPRVGDHVLLSLGEGEEEGIIVEDRGPIGVGGRELYRIEVEFDPYFKAAYELPATDFRVLQPNV